VDLDGVLLNNAFGDEELGDVLPLVALELDDVAQFRVLDNGAVAAEILLEDLEHLFKVHLLRNARGGRERLSTIALLDADVHIVVLGGGRRRSVVEFILRERIVGRSKRV
jgi:hypothetical protein